jgi:hypothetical protein
MMRPDVTNGRMQREGEKKENMEQEGSQGYEERDPGQVCDECQVRTGQSQHTSSSDEDTESPS